MWRKVRLYVVAVMGVLAVGGAVLLAAPRAKAPVERKGRVLDTTTVKVGWTSVRVVKDELLLKLKAGVDKPAALQRLAQKHGFTVDRQNKRTTVYKVKVPQGKKLEDLMAQIAKDGSVQYVEPNYIAQLFSTTPNDPEFDEQWALHNDDDKDIDAPEAWDTTTGSSSIVVAVIDSGIDLDHEDLSPNLWTNTNEIPGNEIDDDENGYVDDVNGWDFANDDNDPEDDYGHGTFVGGIIGAKGNNLKGIAGVTWNSKLMAIKVTGDSSEATYADLADAISYAAGNGASIINISLGGRAPSSALADAIDDAYEEGCVIIAAAGNDGCDLLRYPAAYDKVVSVAATDHSDEITEYSNCSGTSDVAAPGDAILGCTIDVMGYPAFTGTSASSALVSGVAALVRSHNGNLTNAQVMQVLRQGVDPIPTFDTFAPWGRINAAKALARDSSTYQDLAVMCVQVFPEKPLREQTATIKVTVQNQGNEDVNDVDVKAKIDGQQTGSIQTVDLDVGETTTLTWTSWTTPDADDTYTVTGEIETLQNETETADNTKDISVTVDEDTVSDIRIAGMSVSDPFTDSSPMTLTVTVQNVGTQTETDISVKAYIDDEQVDITKTVASLAIGAVAEKTFSWTIPEEPSAEPYIFKGEAVPLDGESETSNNEGALFFQIVDTSTEDVTPQYAAFIGRDMITDAPWRLQPEVFDVPVLFFVEDPYKTGVDIDYIQIMDLYAEPPALVFKDTNAADPNPGGNLTVLDESGSSVGGNIAVNITPNMAGWHRIVLVPMSSLTTIAGHAHLETTICYADRVRRWWCPLGWYRGKLEREAKTFKQTLDIRDSMDKLPTLPDTESKSWTYYDPHYHSISTWGHADGVLAPNKEWGGPLVMTRLSARAINLLEYNEDLPNKVFATDHNFFFNDGYRPDVGPTSGTGNEWTIHETWFGSQTAAQEVTLNDGSTLGNHFLVYEHPSEFTGPWHGGFWFHPNPNTLGATLTAMVDNDSYGYAAHPWERRFEWSDGMCNEALACADTERKEFVFKGFEWWNTRSTLKQNDFDHHNIDPFDVDDHWDDNGEYGDTMKKSINKWTTFIKTHLRFSLEAGGDPKKYFVRKVYAAGGSDAHGDFNYSTSTLWFAASFTSKLTDSAYGKVRTYCLGGIDGFKNGQSVSTDGPLITFTLDSDGKFDSADKEWHDTIIVYENDDGKIGGSGNYDGERTMLVRRDCNDSMLRHYWTNISEFEGNIREHIRVFRIDPTGTQTRDTLDSGAKDAYHDDSKLSDVSSGVDKVSAYVLYPITNPSGSTSDAYNAFGFNDYRCITNPIWAIPMDIDVYYEETHIAHNGSKLARPRVPHPIPAEKLKFVFTCDLSMKDEETVVQIKQLNSAGNSMAEIYPCKTSTWENTETAKDAKYEVKNSEAIEWDRTEPYGDCPPYTFVVYIVNPKDCNGNQLNPIATLFTVLHP